MKHELVDNVLKATAYGLSANCTCGWSSGACPHSSEAQALFGEHQRQGESLVDTAPKQRVLITGLTGFVGSHLADHLLAETDFEIYGLVRARSSLNTISHLVRRINRGDRLHLIYGDLTDSHSIDRAISIAAPDYVFHLAAQSFPQHSYLAPLEAMRTNVEGTLNLLEAVRTAVPKAHVHVCSSSEVYGKVNPLNVPITESCPLRPASPYAISKVGTDLLGQHYAEAYGMMVMVTRMFTHSGARRGDVFAESSFAKQVAMCEAGQIDPPIIRVGNLDSTRTILDVHDAVRAYADMLIKHPKRGAVYNIGGERTVKVRDILGFFISRALCDGIEVVQDPARFRPVDADLQIPNCALFRSEVAWRPTTSYEETLRDLLDYWRVQVHGQQESFLVR